MNSEEKTNVIPLKPTLARKRVLMINDALPGLLLLINGLGSLGGESSHGQFAYLNIIAGGSVIAALAYELKRGNNASHRIVSWFDVIAGCVLIVDAVNHWHPGKLFQPGILIFAVGVFTIIRGLLHARFPTFRRLILTEKGFDLRVKSFRRLQMEWNDLDSARMDGMVLLIKAKAGKTYRFNLSRVENREEVCNSLKNF